MSERDDIWTEKQLAAQFDLPISASGRCEVLTNWIKAGLQHVEIGGRRFYFGGDVWNFILSKRVGG